MNYSRSGMIEIQAYIEIIKEKLYFAVIKNKILQKKIRSNSNLFYFTMDNELIYQNYYNDFGPLNISCLYKFCMKLNKYLQYTKDMKGIVYYTSNLANQKANAAFLMGAYCLIYLKMHPKDITNIMEPIGPFKPFVDASQVSYQFNLKLIDCYQAISKALTINFFNFNDFNDSEYDLYNKFEFGDLNWIVPRKFVAFLGPTDIRMTHSPEFYIKYFLKNDVKTVIRLNSALYNPSVFTEAGIQHYDLIFPDGTVPPKDILLRFLYIAETAPAAIGVHCKAGLGRTGSLIGAYIMKHYRMTARQTIAWLRICRPGSVIGQQQKWLEQIQSWLWRIGSQYRFNRFHEGDKIPRHRYGIYSKLWSLERQKILSTLRKGLKNAQTPLDVSMAPNNNYASSSIDKCLQNNSSSRIHRPQNNSNRKSRTPSKNILSPQAESKVQRSDQNYTKLLLIPNTKDAVSQTISSFKHINFETFSNSIDHPGRLNNRKQLINISEDCENPSSFKYFSMKQIGTQGDKLNYIKMHKNNKLK